jgi:hypothetical protein
LHICKPSFESVCTGILAPWNKDEDHGPLSFAARPPEAARVPRLARLSGLISSWILSSESGQQTAREKEQIKGGFDAGHNEV